jgi:DNA-binding beta-propeller fold protein YncE
LGVTRELAWPSPPAAARVRFVQSLDPAAVQGKPSWLSRVWRAVVGSSDPPRMARPYGIAVVPGRKVYVADTGGAAIHVFDLQKPGHSMIDVEAESLIGVGFAGGRLFATDSTTGRLLCLDEKGRTIWTLGRQDGFSRPTGLVADVDRLYVVDTMGHKVVIVSPDGRVIGSFGERGAEPGQFNFPTNIARGPDDRLYVTDTMNFRVQIFEADGRFVKTFGKLGDGSGDFDKPKGIAVDSEGHIYVVEGFNDVVQIFDADGRLLLVVGGSGSEDGQFWLPSGITIANDVIYVADSANQRLEVFQYLKGVR